MAASTRCRFKTGGLRLPIRLFFPGPRLPVTSGGRILAGKTYRDNFRDRNISGGVQPLEEDLNGRGFAFEVPVEKISLDVFTGPQMKCDVAAVMERFFKKPAEFIKGVGAKSAAF